MTYVQDTCSLSQLTLQCSAVVGFASLVVVFTKLKPIAKDAMSSDKSRQRYIPKHLLPPDVSPRTALLDPKGAMFHSGLMAITLGLLIGTSFLRVEVWLITAPSGLLALVRDLVTEYWSRDRRATRVVEEMEMAEPGRQVGARPVRRRSLPYFVGKFRLRFPTTASTISRLPFSLLLFAGGIFVLSRSLSTLGWISVFARWLAAICVNPAATVFFLG